MSEAGNIVGSLPTENKQGLIIDVSHHNGTIDWYKVKKDKQNIVGAIIKSSEGATGVSNKFYQNVKGCEDAGISWSAYHFATWNDENEERDAAQEAEHFIKTVRKSGFAPKLPLVLDIESNKPIPYTKQEMVVFVKTFRKVVEDAGYEMAIYASPGFLQSYLPSDHPFTRNKLWVADYTGTINPVPGWKSYWLHQYTEKGKVDGINTTVDMNRFVDNG